jgi:NADH-quinone oxidoreductase subunit J
MVLFLFVIMLMNLNANVEPQRNTWMKLAGAISGGSLLLILLSVIRSAGDMRNKVAETKTGSTGLIETLGKALFTEYVVPFEIASVLFLSAMIGAVVIGKKN